MGVEECAIAKKDAGSTDALQDLLGDEPVCEKGVTFISINFPGATVDEVIQRMGEDDELQKNVLAVVKETSKDLESRPRLDTDDGMARFNDLYMKVSALTDKQIASEFSKTLKQLDHKPVPLRGVGGEYCMVERTPSFKHKDLTLKHGVRDFVKVAEKGAADGRIFAENQMDVVCRQRSRTTMRMAQ